MKSQAQRGGRPRSPSRPVHPGADPQEIADRVAARAFLYDDPRSFRAGVGEMLDALRAAGILFRLRPRGSVG